MSDSHPKRDSRSIEEATIFNMWELPRLWKCWSPRGFVPSKTTSVSPTELRKKHPRAKIPETAFPEPYLLMDTENKIIDDILALLSKTELTSHQSLDLFERLGGIIEMGQRVAKGTTR